MDDISQILFEKFKIIECFKKDESSAVYLADHIFLDKKVILKVLNTEYISDSSRIERFKREAKILAKLKHPNIIEVIDFGLSSSSFYISFEYFESKTLRSVINNPEISSEQKEELLAQLLAGLNYAHQNNIIHRDIKPENILVNEPLELKLSDFGLALAQTENSVTNQYSIVGTPSYMSPEQINGKQLDIKSDLFSVGIIIYELFTGVNPFLGNDINETINNIISFDEAAILKKMKYTPQHIKTVIKKLLTKQSELRFNNCIEVQENLNVTTGISSIEFRKIGKSKTGLQLILASTAAVIIIIAVLIIFTDSSQVLREPVSSLEQTESKQPILNENSKEKFVIDSTYETPKEDKKPTVAFEPNLQDDIESKIIPDTQEPEVNSFGSLYVECFPWANILINDRKIETTPLKDNILLTKGEYDLKLTHPDYPHFEQRITIFEDQLNTVKINLDTLLGYLDCKIFPWAEIYINGEKKGETPLEKPVKIFPGNHLLELKNPNYETIKDEIQISRNDTLSLKYRFATAYN